MLTLADALSADGPIAGLVSGFIVREQQQQMAEAVADAIEGRETLVCEAGTGTGKTFAYLVPAIMSGRRVIISTGTKNLQDQLFHRDLPIVREALGMGATVSLLKGRANYLCHQRLAQGEFDGFLFDDLRADFAKVKAWAGQTRTGDTNELSSVPESSLVWPAVTSTAENCLGQECPFIDECFVFSARRDAAAADLVVVNHHLFLADMAIRQEGFGELIPGADAVIFDEAHQLPELAGEFFGNKLSSRQLIELGRDVTRAQQQEAPDQDTLTGLATALERAVDFLRTSFTDNHDRRIEWAQIAEQPSVSDSLVALKECLSNLSTALEPSAERGPALENCRRRAQTIAASLAQFESPEQDTSLLWVESHRKSFVMHRTPIDISQVFVERLSQYNCAWVFTSATLAVGEDFSYFKNRLGLTAVLTEYWQSPYDFERQALLYLPPIKLQPRDRGYTESVIEHIRPVLRASQGRAFLLFTSHRALKEASELLLSDGSNNEFSFFVQGDAPRTELLERFRKAPNAVLLGTSSFWEGVDVRGEALSLVVIDKLPFAAPDDPMLRARAQLMRERGQNPFTDHQLPEAVLSLKQGVGRLIRGEDDCGVLVLCDPRVLQKSYGKAFLKGLPPMRTTRLVNEVEAFYLDMAAAC